MPVSEYEVRFNTTGAPVTEADAQVGLAVPYGSAGGTKTVDHTHALAGGTTVTYGIRSKDATTGLYSAFDETSLVLPAAIAPVVLAYLGGGEFVATVTNTTTGTPVANVAVEFEYTPPRGDGLSPNLRYSPSTPPRTNALGRATVSWSEIASGSGYPIDLSDASSRWTEVGGGHYRASTSSSDPTHPAANLDVAGVWSPPERGWSGIFGPSAESGAVLADVFSSTPNVEMPIGAPSAVTAQSTSAGYPETYNIRLASEFTPSTSRMNLYCVNGVAEDIPGPMAGWTVDPTYHALIETPSDVTIFALSGAPTAGAAWPTESVLWVSSPTLNRETNPFPPVLYTPGWKSAGERASNMAQKEGNEYFYGYHFYYITPA